MKILERYFSIENYGGVQGDENALRTVIATAKSASWKSTVPEQYWDNDPDLIKDSRLRAVFADNGDKGLYVYSGSGTQKTRSVLCLLAKEYMAGKTVMFLSPELFTFSAFDLNDKDGEGRKVLDRAQSCDVLFIDDLFKRRMTEAQEFFLYCILENRGKKKTLITSNISFSEIPSVFTEKGCGNTFEPIISRIRGNCRVLKFS